MTPLDELRKLDAQVEQINDLAGLKPLFYRLDEIAKEHAGDFEVQLMAGDVKQHLVNRGVKLKQSSESGISAPPPLPGSGSTPPPIPAASTPVEVEITPPKKLMSSGLFVPRPSPGADEAAEAPSTGASPGPPPLSSTLPGPPAAPPFEPPAMPPSGGAGSSPSGMPYSPPPGVPPPFASPSEIRSGGPGAPPPPPPSGGSWKRALWMGAAVGVVLAIAGYFAYRGLRGGGATGTSVTVDIVTSPPGASVRINNEPRCTSNCQVPLEPGEYQVTAFLDGYQAAASSLTVTAGQPASVTLTLEPQNLAVRILTDLEQGRVSLDDQPAGDLQDGQMVLEQIAPGMHTVKVTGRNSEATVAFQWAVASPPQLAAPMAVRNLFGVTVASFANQARVATSSGPLKLAVNGQAQADSTPAGVNIDGYQPGVSEIVLGEGQDQRNVKEEFSPAPQLTVFLKSDLNIGTLIVATGEDDVRIFLDNREYSGRTRRGEVRIRRTIGRVNVRVAKDGFENPPPQVAEVKKGGETRLEFTLRPAVQFASLQIRGGTPGADVLLDQRPIGAVGADGAFTNNSVLPGMHTIEMRRDQFQPKRLEREFRAGQTVTISGADAALTAERVPLPPPPPPPKPKEELPPPPKPPKPQPPKVYSMADFDQPDLWRQAEGIYTHRGEAFLTFRPSPRGVFNFTLNLLRGGNIFRGGRVRWFLDYTDNRNYALFEMDDTNFWAKDVVNGRTRDIARTIHKQGEKTWVLQIEVSPERVVHKMQIGDQWYLLYTWDQAGRDFTDGKFGFRVQGNDEIGVSDFRFTAAR